MLCGEGTRLQAMTSGGLGASKKQRRRRLRTACAYSAQHRCKFTNCLIVRHSQNQREFHFLVRLVLQILAVTIFQVLRSRFFVDGAHCDMAYEALADRILWFERAIKNRESWSSKPRL